MSKFMSARTRNIAWSAFGAMVLSGSVMAASSDSRAIDEQYRLYDFADWAALSAALSDDSIQTPNRSIRVPRVVVLSVFEKLPRVRVRFSRLNIYARDDDTCQYCGRKRKRVDLNLDHAPSRSGRGRRASASAS